MGRVINRSLLNTRRLTVNLVTYPEGHRVMRHNDPIGSGSYYKLNFVVMKPIEGGVFETDRVIFSIFNRVTLFRPDLYDHSVSTIMRGKRVLLSIALHAPWGSAAQEQ
ncbi:2OG-Fe(II) oxygenase [Pseudomonas paeninsulae]|uniref:2OG-Fe(II) oxygenase n=1 Tax=Pseudomonas paeninsulae TaxID=3110772 RepID=UPI002D7A3F7B|nr:2OG-Fe(II) oxygenase [Pseudomonas sp. IT1137]